MLKHDLKTIQWNPPHLVIPKSTVVLVAGGGGEGTDRRIHRIFSSKSVLSMHECLSMLGETGDDFSVFQQAMELMQVSLNMRLSMGTFTVVDCPVMAEGQFQGVYEIAERHGFQVLLIILAYPLVERLSENFMSSQPLDERMVLHQFDVLNREVHRLSTTVEEVGPERVVIFEDFQAFEDTVFEVLPIREAFCELRGPFDFIGDIGGDCGVLELLLKTMGYRKRIGVYTHPERRTAVFLGEMIGESARNLETLRTIKKMVDDDAALYVLGRRTRRLARYFQGRPLYMGPASYDGFLESVLLEMRMLEGVEMQGVSNIFMSLYRNAPHVLILDEGRLIAAHMFRGQRTVRIPAALRCMLLGENRCSDGVDGNDIDLDGWPMMIHCRHGVGNSMKAQEPEDAGLIKTVQLKGYREQQSPENLRQCRDVTVGMEESGCLTGFRYPEMEFVKVCL